MEFDEDKNINIIVSYPNKRLRSIQQISNFEKFILDLAFKISLYEINNQNKADWFAIDEGFGSCSGENIDKIKISLFNYLKLKFRFVIIISHRNELKLDVDNNFLITKQNNGSHIEIQLNPKKSVEIIKKSKLNLKLKKKIN